VPAVLMAVMLVACSTTGGTIGNLIPAPKLLKGEIRNNVYYAPNGVLSVAVPFAKGTYEYTYLQIKEEFNATTELVVFGPAAYDRGIYRVQVVERRDGLDTPDAFNADAPDIMRGAREMVQNDGRAPLEELRKDEEPVNGHPTLHERVTQHVPPGVLSNHPELLTYDLYVMQFGAKVAIAMVMRPEKSYADPPAISVAAFVQSVQVP
jgi:hypothetical protein